jgi:hypothetical protein
VPANDDASDAPLASTREVSFPSTVQVSRMTPPTASVTVDTRPKASRAQSMVTPIGSVTATGRPAENVLAFKPDENATLGEPAESSDGQTPSVHLALLLDFCPVLDIFIPIVRIDD